jgi:hypothetical protein
MKLIRKEYPVCCFEIYLLTGEKKIVRVFFPLLKIGNFPSLLLQLNAIYYNNLKNTVIVTAGNFEP